MISTFSRVSMIFIHYFPYNFTAKAKILSVWCVSLSLYYLQDLGTNIATLFVSIFAFQKVTQFSGPR